MIRDGVTADYAELARLGKVSRARLTQVMNLLLLATDIQEVILFLQRVVEGDDPVSLRQLQVIGGGNEGCGEHADGSTVVRGVCCTRMTRPDSEVGASTPGVYVYRPLRAIEDKMAKRRKSKTELDQEWRREERRVWEAFVPKVQALQSIVQAQLLVRDAPPPDSPGRGFYSNLGFFIASFIVPAGSNAEERALYLRCIQRWDDAGEINPGVADQVKKALQQGIHDLRPDA